MGLHHHNNKTLLTTHNTAMKTLLQWMQTGISINQPPSSQQSQKTCRLKIQNQQSLRKKRLKIRLARIVTASSLICLVLLLPTASVQAFNPFEMLSSFVKLPGVTTTSSAVSKSTSNSFSHASSSSSSDDSQSR